jgi:hypothetical protein
MDVSVKRVTASCLSAPTTPTKMLITTIVWKLTQSQGHSILRQLTYRVMVGCSIQHCHAGHEDFRMTYVTY